MKNNFSSFLTQKGRWLLATLTLLFTLSIGQMWGANGDVLFTQNFNSVNSTDGLAFRYTWSGTSTYTYTYDAETPLSGLVGNSANLFTSFYSSIKKGDVAVNSSSGGGSASDKTIDATGIFQAYSGGDNAGYWSLIRTTDFAATAPTALKISMDLYFNPLASGSRNAIQFAVGDGFADGLKSTTSQATSVVHSGFAIKGNNTATITKYDAHGTNLYATGIQGEWKSIVWVINNTGDKLEYDNPTGSGKTELNNDCFDLWIKPKDSGTYTRVVENSAAFTADKDLQNIHIGCNISGAKHEFRLDNVVVTDLTPAAPTNYTVTIDPNGGSYTSTPDGWTLSAGVYTKSVAAGSFTPPTGLTNGTKDLTWKDNHGTGITFPITLAKDSTFIAQWADHSESSDATLKALSVAGCSLNETFDPDEEDYTISLPFYASMPTTSAVTATKNDVNAEDPEVSISGSVITVHCVAEDGTTEKDYTITVTIAPTPTASSSINIEQAVLDYGTKYNIGNALNDAHIAFVDKDALDSLKNQEGRNEPYLGLKFKKATSKVTIIVPASTALNVKFGYVDGSAGLKVSVNGSTPAAPSLTSGVYTLAASAGVKEVVFTQTAAKTVVYKQIMVGEDIKSVQLPWLVTYDAGEHGTCATAKETWKGSALTLPTLATLESGWDFNGWNDGVNTYAASASYTPSADVTLTAQYTAQASPFDLTSLTYKIGEGAATNVGYVDGTFTYNIELPYKPSYDAITVAPTLKVGTSYLKGDEVLTVSSLPGAATFTVVEAGGANEKLYTVNFTKKAKDGTSLIKAVATATAQDITGTNLTGAFKGAAHIETASSYKLNEDKYFMVQLVAGQNFQAGDIVKINVSAVNDCNGFTLYSSDEFTAANLIIDTHTNSDAVAKISADINEVELPSSFLGSNKLYVARAHGADKYLNAGINQVEVTRVLNPQLVAITIDGADGDINEAAKTVELTLPYSSDLAALTIVPTIAWNAAAAENSIVVNDGAAWTEGVNTYKLTDKDGDATTYTITLTKAPHYEAQIGTTKYTTVAAAMDAVQAGETIQLLDNCSYNMTWAVDKNVTLDLNGDTLTFGGMQPAINVTAGTLTLKDATATVSPTIDMTVNPLDEEAVTYASGHFNMGNSWGVKIQSGAAAVVESGSYEAGEAILNVYGAATATVNDGLLYTHDNGVIMGNGLAEHAGYTINVNGGILIGHITTGGYASMVIYHPNSGALNITDGILISTNGPGVVVRGGASNITGGTIIANGAGSGKCGDASLVLPAVGVAYDFKSAYPGVSSIDAAISGTADVSGQAGAVQAIYASTEPTAVEESKVNISGGTFSSVVPAACCADGFAPVTTPNAQGKYEVEDKRIYIFDGSTMSNMATSPSGAIAWAKVGDTMGEASKSGTYDEVNYTKALQLKNSSTTKHFRIDVDINNNAKIEVIGMSNDDSETRRAWLTNSTDKGDFADAIAGLTTTGYNPAMFATDWLEEGSYYLHADNTVNIFLIRVTSKEVDPKCEQPTITTQPATDLTFGAGNMTATVEAEVSDGGTLKYQWYNADGDVAVTGQTTATLTTAVDGTYYVIVTNTLADHRDNSVKSADATLAHRVMDDATLKSLKYGTTAIALEDDVYEYRVDLAENTTEVPALSATATMDGYATVTIHDAAAFVEYEATSTVDVTSEDGTANKTYTVKFYVDHQIDALVDVTGDMSWDFSKAEGGTTASSSMCTEAILANVEGVVNNSDFESDNIMATANKFAGGKLQASMIKFHTTVDGVITVVFSNTGTKTTARYLVVNGHKTAKGSKVNSSNTTYKGFVPAGDVVLTVVDGDGNMLNFTSIDFKAKATSDYDRTVNPNNIGTLCWTNNAVLVNATLYAIAGKDANNKLVFDEVDDNIVVAGKPYIFIPENGNTKILVYNTDNEAALTNNDLEPFKGMQGTFVDLTTVGTTEGDGELWYKYIISNNKYIYVDYTNCRLGAYRAYVLSLDNVPDANDEPEPTSNGAPRRRISISGEAPAVVTGMDELNASEQPVKMIIDGKMYILRGEKMYDATGRLVK